jgi:hypothetical protein
VARIRNIIRSYDPVRTVFSEQGRGEDGTDPDGSFLVEFFVPLKPFNEWPRGLTKQAVLGGALGGGRGAAVGAIVGGPTGAAIAAQGQPRPGGYRYYQQGCYQQRGDGAWVVVAPEYCATAAAPPGEVAPSPPRARIVRDELRDRMLELRERCEDGERRACVRLGIIIGENRERRAAWRREHPEVFFYERD